MTNQANRPAGAPRIKGWCPGAWRPMASGDGLLVRVRPPLGRLTRHQMLALCEAAETFGSGLIELTNRANLQLRGVSDASWPGLMTFLVEHGLVAADPQEERRLPLLLAPDWQPGDATHEVARRLEARLDALPALPAKMGVAIDAGAVPLLGEVSADFRIERSLEGGLPARASGALPARASGALLVRADGREKGTPVDSPAAAVELLIRLLHWFVDSGGIDAGRMRRHPAPLPPWAPATQRPAAAGCVPALGQHAWGRVLGLPFGRAPAATLRAAVIADSVGAVRVTPWRRLLVEGFPVGAPSPPGLLESESDPRLAMQACPGAPYCEQASVATLGLAQELAERLDGQVAGSIHLSGCVKGCACQTPTDLCLTGREGRFDLIVGGRADGTPVATGLDESDVIEHLEKNRDALRL
ncbi:cobalamin biosynthesis protein CobG [Billgrantia desiderata]|uniref:Cobalamin biosynthesis protein CobG n=1 Tax=Billgrantia desiderata TaxID=52021 RepID=A0ABS9B3E7_9GAMM|nr:cobalamin biosynthesis protein CobG [Halomonas desiderata]MCE8029318.1 cobalamin biosynthesis protein CobG [Halomonas desiderata]MCE8041945.1 cobalamin biosynthesis protein CobG [Halomonas desiderata]MCE8046520.1 cobalamin biosynthesis protein CobG [Halomonas desiderata]